MENFFVRLSSLRHDQYVLIDKLLTYLDFKEKTTASEMVEFLNTFTAYDRSLISNLFKIFDNSKDEFTLKEIETILDNNKAIKQVFANWFHFYIYDCSLETLITEANIDKKFGQTDKIKIFLNGYFLVLKNKENDHCLKLIFMKNLKMKLINKNSSIELRYNNNTTICEFYNIKDFESFVRILKDKLEIFPSEDIVINHKIAEGSYSKVYRAYSASLDKEFALKVIEKNYIDVKLLKMLV